jgi:cyclase
MASTRVPLLHLNGIARATLTLGCARPTYAMFRRQIPATFALVATAILLAIPAAAQETSPRPRPPTVKQITSDIYFFFDYAGSNSVFLVTDEGVLVIDTGTHPRVGQDLIDRIRKVTNKPIKWVINSHFHGDHNFGNAPFKAAGATFVAQKETTRIMKQVYPKEIARRRNGFLKVGWDPNDVKLILADVTFDTEMTIYLGGREVRLFYLGPAQNPGDTFVLFPQERVLFTPGGIVNHSIPNFAFTPSVDNWIKLVDQVAARSDYDRFLPAHGDVGSHEDVKQFAAMLTDLYTTVKEAVAKGMSSEEAQQKLTFPQYKDWRDYERMKDGTTIKGLYELIQTGQRSYFE